MVSTSQILTAPGTAQTGPCTRLRVQLVRGSVDVVPREAAGVGVEVLEIEGAPLEVAGEGDRASIGYPSIGWDGWLKRLASSQETDRAVLRVAVGPGTSVSFATVGAAITVTGLAEDVEAVTASAPVTASGTRSGIEVRTASGDVVATDHDGPVSVVSVSGDARLEGRLPRASVTTVSGAARLEHRGGAAVLTTTTVSGATAVQLPAGTEVDLEVRAVTGSVTLDGADRRSGAVTRHHEPGAGDRVTVRATTVSGAVDVTRLDPPQLDRTADPS